MFDFIWKVMEHKEQIAAAVAQISAGIVALSAIISTLLPPPTKPGSYTRVYKAINLAGQNYGHAKNNNVPPFI